MITQPIKIVFLDIDGVICFGDDIIEPEKIKLLNQLIAETGAYIVISSSLRKIYTRTELCDLLNQAGFQGTILGVTPNLNSRRGLEIKEWLKTKRYKILSFVILDDNSDFEAVGLDRLVQTNSFQGLQCSHIKQAKKILDKEL
jgi:hypothetical protein